MKRLTWLSVLALTLWTGCGDDDGGDDPPAEGTDTTKVSQALTTSVEFKDGLLQQGSIPESSNDKVTLRQDEDKVRLKPGVASLMALEVENPDEDQDPVQSTLLQFEKSDEHIEVTKSSGGADAGDAGLVDPSRIEISFEVGEEICADLCNQTFEIKMDQAVKLEGGDVSAKLVRIFELDCTDDGDADKCGNAKPDAGTMTRPDGGMTGAAGTGATGGSATAATELRRALNTVNMTACMCADGTGTTCAAAPYPAAAITCINTMVQDDGALTAGASCLGAFLNRETTACSCDMTCLDGLLSEGLGTCTMVEALMSSLQECEFELAAP